ncbi:hypothetical protein HanPI659440_Chr03g0123651 [Helianthus annuus]|nr:hypothetical protein HanPI659440_Chr03g0123651 [Helianthus annuus]
MQTQESLLSLKAAFDQMQATFSKPEKQGTMVPRNEGDRISNNRLTMLEELRQIYEELPEYLEEVLSLELARQIGLL